MREVKFYSSHHLTFDVQAISVELGSNRSSRMVVIPELIVLPVLAVRDHLSTCLGTSTLYVEYQPIQSAHYDVVRHFLFALKYQQ